MVIVDWDIHHGNGTQRLFYDDPRVLFISLHRYGDRWYPETGAVNEVGEGSAKGFTINVPWPEDGMNDSDYFAAIELVVVPVISSFSPDLLLISAGEYYPPVSLSPPPFFPFLSLRTAPSTIRTRVRCGRW